LLKKAVELNKGEPDFWVYLGFATYSAKGSVAVKEARDQINTGLEMKERIDAGHEFLGRIARMEGNNKLAETELKTAVKMSPKNVEAQRELRLLTMRQNESPKKAGIGDILGKFLKR